MAENLFSIDFNSIGDTELIEVDTPQAVKPVGEEDNTPVAGSKDTKPVEGKGKEKKDENLIEVETKDDGDEPVASAQKPQSVKNTNKEGKDETGNVPSNDEQSPFTPFAKALHEEGILPNLDIEKFEGNADNLFSAVKNEITIGIDSYKESLPPVIKEIIDNYEEGIPLNELIDNKSKQIEYASIKEEDLKDNEVLQKAVVRDLLKNKGFKDAKIDKLLQTIEDGGKLYEDATESLTELKEIHQEYLAEQKVLATQRNKDIEKRNQDTLTNLRNLVDKTEEIIPEVKLNKLIKDKIYNSMTMVTSVDERGNPMNKVMEIRKKDPQKFEMTLHYLAELGIFEGDWSKIKSKAKTSAVKELEEKISKNTSFSKGNGASSASGSKSSSSFIDAIKLFGR